MKQPAHWHIRPCMPKTHPKHIMMGWLVGHQCRQIIFHWSSGYDRYMTGIYMSYVCISLSSTLQVGGLPGLPGALCSCTPALWPLADLHCFSNRETGNTRLGQSKVPQPGVDLIHMAASDLFMVYSFFLWLTYANHVHFYNLWFTYGLLMICLYFTDDLLMIYLWFTYDLLILLMTYLCKSCFLFFTYNLLMIYLCFTYVLLIFDSWWHIFFMIYL
jgi:hypothetical protein